MRSFEGKDLTELRDRWADRWEEALALWSRFTKLSRPRWCFTEKEEKAENLFGSFAMIRLVDHAVVISLKQLKDRHLEGFPLEIMAHEIGHHVYAPADLRDNARLLARTRAGLPSREALAGLVSNLYTDLLINDRLQRGAGLRMAEVYRRLRPAAADRLWQLYMRVYEVLWSLPPESLVSGAIDKQVNGDAQLGARVIRAYAKDWFDGAGRFAALLLPYLLSEEYEATTVRIAPWLDTREAGAGDEIPDGLSEVEEGEEEGAIHPALDPEITGLGRDDQEWPGEEGRETVGGQKNRYRDPQGYVDLMRSLGVAVPEKEMVMRYYRERAVRHLIRFPVREIEEAQDPLPEGLDVWEVSSPLTEVDWTESFVRSPHVIPGVTTVQRTYGTSQGTSPEHIPVDLYLGVDCSGSMLNPAVNLSYPVLAGAIIVLSALRTGARVMACLSGEPGEHTETKGFVRSEREILKVLTGYLGTGYSFGMLRLKEALLGGERPPRPAHILIVTDADIFYMIKQLKDGWAIAEDAPKAAGGGATLVLNIAGPGGYTQEVGRLKDLGWSIHYVQNWPDIIAFARAFSQAKYGQRGASGERKPPVQG